MIPREKQVCLELRFIWITFTKRFRTFNFSKIHFHVERVWAQLHTKKEVHPAKINDIEGEETAILMGNMKRILYISLKRTPASTWVKEGRYILQPHSEFN